MPPPLPMCTGTNGPATASNDIKCHRFPVPRRSQSLPNLAADGHSSGVGVWPSHWASLPPLQYVDYLHHPWTDDDLTNSWKLVTKLKHTDRALKLGGKGERLEYLTWRIWIQRTRKLPKTHPYTIHWEKDSSHLYAPGPIFRFKSCLHLLPADLPTPTSPPSSALSTPPLSPTAATSPDHHKGCLKRQTLRDFLLRPLHSPNTPSIHLSDPPTCWSSNARVAQRRRTAEQHERLMRDALLTATTVPANDQQQSILSHRTPDSNNAAADSQVLVCTATASHPMREAVLDKDDAQVVRFNHVIEERVIAGPTRAVVVASRKRRSRSLVLAVLDGNEAKAYRQVVDKWVGLDAGRRKLPSLTETSRGRPRARSDPPAFDEHVSARNGSFHYGPQPPPKSLSPPMQLHHRHHPNHQRASTHASSRSIQDSAIAFSALVDDLLSSPENDDAALFVSTQPSQSLSWSRSPPSSSTSRSPSPFRPLTSPGDGTSAPPTDSSSQNTNVTSDQTNDNGFDDDTPTWERSTLARGRDHALPPFHVDESTLAMLSLPYAVGILPPPSVTMSGHARVSQVAEPPDPARSVGFLPTPPPSSPVVSSGEPSATADTDGGVEVRSGTNLAIPIKLPQHSPASHLPLARLEAPTRRIPHEAPALARIVARGTGWGIGHLDEVELGLETSAEDQPMEGDAGGAPVGEEEDNPLIEQPNGSMKEVVVHVADTVAWLVSTVVGRAGSFST